MWTHALPTKLTLADNAVDIWYADLDALAGDIDACRSLLDSAESARLERLRLEHLRRRFAVRHGILRRLLGAYVSCDPASLSFALNPSGKSELNQPAGRRIFFNLSHSDACAVYAVTRIGVLGVDVERAVPFDNLRQVAGTTFSETEQVALTQLPNEQQVIGFYNGWTRKEALVKALGQGISFPLESFSVSLHPGEPARLLTAHDERLRTLTLLTIPLPAPLVAACAGQTGWNQYLSNYKPSSF